MSGGEDSTDPRRSLPSVDVLMLRDDVAPWIERWGRGAVLDAIRRSLDRWRADPPAGDTWSASDAVLRDTLADLGEQPSLRAVLNGTGVILHTNLGRAPMADEAVEAVAEIAARYSTLEYDLGRGARGDRYSHCRELLCRLTASEDALVVNNNAAAVALAISALARGRDVIVARGELVEIGGGFRIPEVIESSGGFLREVGTTNRTRVDDYRKAVTPSTGLLLKVHPSNYRIEGFVEETSILELGELGAELDVPVLHDIGSGSFLPVGAATETAEPSPVDSIRAGADLVTWSGDKLFGGPQAGLIHGRRAAIDRLRSDPLLRAFRADKMTLAALEATLRLHANPEQASRRLPALRMLLEPAQAVEERARQALQRVPPPARSRVRVRSLLSVVGGGTSPGVQVASAGWHVTGPASRLSAFLRESSPPLIARIEEGEIVIDFRTILPGEGKAVARIVDRALNAVEGEA